MSTEEQMEPLPVWDDAKEWRAEERASTADVVIAHNGVKVVAHLLDIMRACQALRWYPAYVVAESDREKTAMIVKRLWTALVKAGRYERMKEWL